MSQYSSASILEHDPALTRDPSSDGGSPGKRSLTQGLSPRSIIFRVESAEAARELGAAFGPRDRNGVAEGAEAAVDRAGAGSGAPLRADLRERFEGSLGADLSGVRVHTGADSAAASDAVGARAYTVGNDIHFGAGQYQPDDPFGIHLLAHEVAHTVQQAGGAAQVQYKLHVSGPADAAEVEADRAADAMVAGRAATVGGAAGGGLARKGKELSAEEKNRLANAKQLIERANANASKAISALDAYGTSGASALQSIKASHDAYIEVYEGEFKLVNAKISSAKATLALQEQVLIGALGAVFGPVANGIVSAELGIASTIQAVQDGYAALSEWMEPIGGAMVDGTKDTAGHQAGGQTGLDEGGDGSPIAKKLAFWQSFAKLQGSSTRLVGLAAKAAEINKAIGKVQEAIAGCQSSGQARSDYAPEKIEDDAARLEGGTRTLASAAPSVTGALSKMKAADTQAKALKPDKKAIEKEIWINWAGSLPASETGVNGILDADEIEDHLRKIGVWQQLGIEIGGVFEDDEEALAVASANAISRVLAHKGATAEVEVFGSVPMGKVQVGDLPALPVTVSGIPPLAYGGPGADRTRTVKAQVINAAATKTLDTSLFKGASRESRNKSNLSDLLLNEGLIRVEMQSLEVVQTPAPEAKPGLGPPTTQVSPVD